MIAAGNFAIFSSRRGRIPLSRAVVHPLWMRAVFCVWLTSLSIWIGCFGSGWLRGWAPRRRQGSRGPGLAGSQRGRYPPTPLPLIFPEGGTPLRVLGKNPLLLICGKLLAAACPAENFLRLILCGRKNRSLTHSRVGGVGGISPPRLFLGGGGPPLWFS